jgi:hypothetical protein
MMQHEGGCLWGATRFKVVAEALDSGYCHCRLCQLNSGAPVVAWVTFPAESFAWTAGKPGTYASSAHGTRSFCATCGSYLVFASTRAPGEVSINTASFDDPGAFAPRKHIFVASQIPWFQTGDDLPRHVGSA